MSDNENISFEEYGAVMNATKDILSKRIESKAYFDFMRAKDAKQVYFKFLNGQAISDIEAKSYLTKAIDPSLIIDLSQQDFHSLKKLYGNGIFLLRMIDGNLQRWIQEKREKNILVTGGACALETLDIKIKKAKQRQYGYREAYNYVKTVLNNGVFWTQITEAIVPSRGLNVFYEEVFPWYLRFNDYGIENAELVVSNMYNNIFDAVKRYAKLINPDSHILKISFFKLNLFKKGFLGEWYDQFSQYIDYYRIKYNLSTEQEYNLEEFVRGWVLYSYIGPRIGDIIKQIIKDDYPLYYDRYALDQETLHLRSKQIDHLTTEAHTGWYNKILLNVDSKKLATYIKLLGNPFNQLELACYKWLQINHKQHSTLGFAGRLANNYQGSFMREEYMVSHKINDNDNIGRLHSNNVEKFINFLQFFLFYDDKAKMLPLVDNLLVSYMQQLLFLKEIRDSYLFLADVENNEKMSIEIKERLIKKSIKKIFPLIEYNIRYIMLGSS